MKKVVFIGGIVLLLSATIAILLISRSQQKKSTTTISIKKEVTPFVLTLKSGIVEYRKNSTDTYIILATGSVALPTKSSVKTSKGTAEVLLENGTMISVDENTEVTLGADSTGIKIQQFLGNTWHRVQKLLGVQTYQVITPTAVATVRGTKFGVRTLVGISKIITTENTVGVQLRTITPEGKEKLGKEEPVPAGNESEILEAEREVIIQEISPEEKSDTWFKKNEEYDKKYDEKVEELKKEFEKVKSEEEKVIETNPTPVGRLVSPDRGGEREEDKKETDETREGGLREIKFKNDEINNNRDFWLEPPPTRPPFGDRNPPSPLNTQSFGEAKENPTPARHALQGDAGRQPSPDRGGEREEPTRPPLEGVSKEEKEEVRRVEDVKLNGVPR